MRKTGKKPSSKHTGLRTRGLLKAVACCAVALVFALISLTVGDADYRATPVGWVPFFAVVVGLLLSWMYVRLSARALSFTDRSILGDCPRGSTVSFTVQFKNPLPLFFFRVEAFFYLSDLDGNVAKETRTTLSLAPFEVYDLVFETVFDHVGEYRAGLERVVVHDFLNLFSHTLRNDTPTTVCVTPCLQDVGAIRFSDEESMETLQAAKATLADSMDYAYTRPYAAGDPLKTVHWKLSARSESLQTRLFEVYTNPGVSVVLDFCVRGQTAQESMELLDCVVEAGLSIAWFAQTQGMEVDIRYCDKQGTSCRLSGWNNDRAADFVRDMPRPTEGEARQSETLSLLEEMTHGRIGQNNVVLCSANLDADTMSAVLGIKFARRTPLVVAVVPSRLVDKDYERHCAPLRRLDVAAVKYIVLSKSSDLSEVSV